MSTHVARNHDHRLPAAGGPAGNPGYSQYAYDELTGHNASQPLGISPLPFLRTHDSGHVCLCAWAPGAIGPAMKRIWDCAPAGAAVPLAECDFYRESSPGLMAGWEAMLKAAWCGLLEVTLTPAGDGWQVRSGPNDIDAAWDLVKSVRGPLGRRAGSLGKTYGPVTYPAGAAIPSPVWP